MINFYEPNTPEYDNYWREQHHRAIQLIKFKNEQDEQTRNYLESINYYHNFGKERVCDCGMTSKRFFNSTVDERWQGLEEFICSNHEQRVS